MKTGETPELVSREEFRDWLDRYHQERNEIWLVYYYKHIGKQSIGYGESVEEAICFGWIDGQQNKMDEERFVRRFSPRKNISHWSKYNRERALKMLRVGKMTQAGMEVLQEGMLEGWEGEIADGVPFRSKGSGVSV
jgi:uncharacterized protein YdeI (YjbR/CyaY-like superfamily)